MAKANSSTRRRASTVRFADLAGQQFGRLTVVDFAGRGKWNQRQWNCICACGKARVVNTAELSNGKTRSCGCLHREMSSKQLTTHGLCRTPEYKVWKRMIERCYNPSRNHYEDYGGRGISVCDHWRSSPANFLKDMGPRPTPTHEIDRIDNNGNYEPGNCRWATRKAQNRNRRSNRHLTHNGDTMTVADWSDKIGISQQLIYARLHRGKTIEGALSVTKQRRPPRSTGCVK